MIELLELIKIEKNKGYSDANASAKVCQDLILKAISNGPLNRNVTIKGGVVMRSKTNNIRRATQDLDIDFIKYSLSNSSIDLFIDKLNSLDEINFSRIGEIEELNQQDYHGKRVFIQITDSTGYQINSKIDLGVHNKMEIEQENYCFDISFTEDGASLLINTNEQMFSEKLRSLLKFGPASTRYKDIFDMYYLIDHIDYQKLELCLISYIYQDDGMREQNVNDVLKRVRMTFMNKMYQKRIHTSDKKWIDDNIENIFEKIISFLESFV